MTKPETLDVSLCLDKKFEQPFQFSLPNIFFLKKDIKTYTKQKSVFWDTKIDKCR